ncbi:acyl carrier protein [Psychrobacter immobilis]|uniref:acyl carrier protein n=1 Tax=Psychrobacter immobilis TaxID=498 RepID=UPI00191ADA5F|nr:acyl carrier protein [Psychrobacter immobilis]
MKQEEVMQLVSNAIEDTFMVDASEITGDTVAMDISGWDSLSHTILLSNIEDAIDQTLAIDDLNFNNVGELVDIITAQLNS